MIHEENFRSRAQIVRQSARAHLLDIRRARLAKRGTRAESEQPVAEAVDSIAVLVEEPIVSQSEPVVATPVPEPLPPLQEPPPVKTLHDDIDQVARKNLTLEEPAPEAVAAPLRLSNPVVAGTPQKGAAKLAADKKVAKPKARKSVFVAGPAYDTEDRAVRSAALADLAEMPKLASTVPQVAVAEVPETETPPPHVADVGKALSAEVVDQPMAFSAEEEKPAQTGMAAATETVPPVAKSDLGRLPGAGPGLVWMLHQCGIHNLEDLARTEASVLVPKLGLVGQILNVEVWLDFARKSQSAQA